MFTFHFLEELGETLGGMWDKLGQKFMAGHTEWTCLEQTETSSCAEGLGGRVIGLHRKYNETRDCIMGECLLD